MENTKMQMYPISHPSRAAAGLARWACFLAASLAINVSAWAQSSPRTQEAPVQDVVANAGDSDPVLVVTLASMDKLTQDVNYLTGMVGQPQLGGFFSLMANSYFQGLDVNQPIGVLVPLVNGVPQPIAVLPTGDIKPMLKRLEAQTGGPADVLDDGTMVISFGANTIFIRQNTDWAALAPRQDLLDYAPADPSGLFEGMGNAYDLAMRLRLQQVPLETRNMLVGQLRQGFEQAMQRTKAELKEGDAIAKASIEDIEQLINDTDELNFGINIDRLGQQIAIDVAFTAVEGTEFADTLGGTQPIPSQFADVIREDAAAYYHASGSISPQAIEQTTRSLRSSFQSISGLLGQQSGLTKDDVNDIDRLMDQVTELAVQSIQEGRSDIGALLLTDDDSFQFVLGSFVADGNAAAQIAKDVANRLENEPGAPRFEFDRSTYQGVTMHLVEADVPADEDEARKVFGEKVQVHIGTGEKSVYVAVGKDSQMLMKKLIDSRDADTSNKTQRPIGQFKLKLKPILEFARSIEANDVISAMVDELSRSSDLGLVTILQEGIPSGQKTHITFSEGLLKAIGAATSMAQARGRGQF